MTLISVAEAAERLGVSISRVHQWIAEGRLAATRIGKIWAIEGDDLQKPEPRKPGRPRKGT